MELTRYDRERLGQLAGAVSLGAHALPAFGYAGKMLSLPMEAGGLVLGPLLGFPLLVLAVVMVIGAIVLPTGRTPFFPFAALALTVLVDTVLVLTGTGLPWALLGAGLSAISLGMFVSLATFSLGMPGREQGVGDQAVLMVVAMTGAGGLALVLAMLGR